MLKETSNV